LSDAAADQAGGLEYQLNAVRQIIDHMRVASDGTLTFENWDQSAG
jgi:hypothetical protein